MKLGNHFLEGLLTKVSDLDHILFGLVRKVFYRVNAGALQAVEGTNRHVKLLNGHLKDLLLNGFRSLNHNFGVFRLIRKINEQVEMLVENLGRQRNGLLSRDGSVGKYLKVSLS